VRRKEKIVGKAYFLLNSSTQMIVLQKLSLKNNGMMEDERMEECLDE